ncbi:MAG: patatin-like phospholipase family protein [Stappiaceae bacterium]
MDKATGRATDEENATVNFPDLDYVDDESRLLDEEVQTIEAVRKIDRSQLFGVAFSGGGIRSGVFCLGVMQKLAASGVFKYVDYLSTVSGGGYIGSALAWWLSGKSSRKHADTTDMFDTSKHVPWGISDPGEVEASPNAILSYLRRNGKYLIPGNGITLVSGLSVVLRAVLLNLLVWIPFFAAIFVFLHWMGPTHSAADNILPFATNSEFTAVYKFSLLAAALVSLIFLTLSVQFSVLSWSRRPKYNSNHDANTSNFVDDRFDIQKILSLAAAGLVLFLILFVVVSAGSLISSIIAIEPRLLENVGLMPWLQLYFMWLHNHMGSAIAIFVLAAIVSLLASINDRLSENKGAIFSSILLLLALTVFVADSRHETFLTSTLVALPGFLVVISAMLINYRLGRLFRLLRRKPPLSVRYSGRRSFEIWGGRFLICIAILLAIGTLPLVHGQYGTAAEKNGGGLTGALGVLGGVVSALWGFYQSRGKGSGGPTTGLILKLGAVALLYGVVLISFDIAGKVSYASGFVELTTKEPAVKTAPESLFSVHDSNLITQAVFWSFFVIAIATGVFTNLNYISLGRFYRDRLVEAFMPDLENVQEDKISAAALADKLKLSETWKNRKGPFPLINTNVVLANSSTRKYRQRGGASFILSPFMCGSDATGWRRTEQFDGNEMTLATAMAISGAAANPRAGVGGKGITRSAAVSLVMNLLNFRLGYWVNNPKKSKWLRFNMRPNHFYPSGAYAIPGRGYKEKSHFLELSDGGHFENLGLYELVRRRCRFIIVCDGGQDNSASYSDFVTAIRRVEEDFGAKIILGKDAGPENMIAKSRKGAYPSDALYADKGYFVAKIDYGKQRGVEKWAREGLIIYMKTTMIEGLSMKAKGYKGANPDFPDQSTGDQFFDDEQFEAYRELGYRIATQAVDDLKLDDGFKNGQRKFDSNWEENILKEAAVKPTKDNVSKRNARTLLRTKGNL